MARYCRQWILGYTAIVKPLHELTIDKSPDPLEWSSEAKNAFTQLKQALSRSPALGIPDYQKPFTLYCHEKNGVALGVLTQSHGDKQRPVAYYNSPLDPVAAGLPPCLRAVAAAAALVESSASLVLESTLCLAVPHAVTSLLLKSKTQHLSNSRLTKYEMLLLNASNVTLTRCAVLNPASLLPAEGDGEPHDCLTLTADLTTPRADLKDISLSNPELIFYVDGSCLRNPSGSLVAGYAVCSQHEITEAHSLPAVHSGTHCPY
ncbi:hypothetical protein G0U57_014216 [Chelydra serpentina]|uniref:Reverse transcriptase/retrotransposon-derived protein RNase H-like domain-containing protein n=1 Tax=Chelydra serpentina TaxID=8475 RepID=A0A8T1SAF0_CHESE|nr:hypothetical protein G0U57_014216 [Chelydra serpentina]